MSRVSNKVKVWVGLSLLVALVAFSVPLGVAASGRWPIPDDISEGVEPKAIGPEVELASGTNNGVDWRLLANESDQGICVTLEHTGGPRDGGGGGCGFDLPGRVVGVNETGVPAANMAVVSGPTVTDVEQVTLILHNGKVINLPTKAAPAELDRELNFYVAVIPESSPEASVRTVVGLNALDGVIGQVDLPTPPHMAPGGNPTLDRDSGNAEENVHSH